MTLAAELISRASRRVLLVGTRSERANIIAEPADTIDLCAGDWSPRLARVTARHLWSHAFAGREVCILGRRALRAFRRLCPALDALTEAPPFSLASPTVPNPAGGWARAMCWWAPHPIGRGRWWANPANRAAGEAFFGYVLGRLEFPARPEIPAPARGLLELVLDEMRAAG